MRPRLLAIFAAMLAAVYPATAQEQKSEIIQVAPDMFLRWFGHADRTYFVQISDPNDHLRKWIWAPIIETGNDEDISYEVDGTADKGFFRLWFTDEPTADPDGGDFDGDGLSNLAEVQTHQTNPLKTDTDGDGIQDRWEIVHLLNPLLDDAGDQFQGGYTTNLEAFQAGVQADPDATIEDYDGDSILNDLDSTPLDKDEFVVVVDTKFLEVFWDQGGEHRTTSAWSESFSIDRVFLRYPDYGIYVPIAYALNSSGSSGRLEKASVRIEATQTSAITRKVKFLDVLDTDYRSLLSAVPSITTRRVVEFTIHAGSISSQTIQFDPGVDDLTQTTPDLDKAAYLARAEIVPDDDQPRKTGDQIPSNKGAEGEKHYVSPKKNTEIPDDFVVLKAKGIEPALFEKVIEWECLPAANGSVDPNDSTKYRVKRDAAGKTVVKLKAKQGGQIADLMNVWVVWATMNGRIQGAGFSANNDLSLDDFEMTQLGSHEATFTREFPQIDGTTDWTFHLLFINGIEWRADIEPKSMFELDDDIPDLTKVTQKDQNPPLTFDGGRAYYTHWDVSRDRKMTQILDGITVVEELNWVIDDDVNYSRDEDPYEQSTQKDESGEIFSVDSPGADTIRKEDLGEPIVYIPDGNSFEVKHVFKEWSRVRLSGKWFDISDKADWFSNVKINKVNGVWSAETQEIGLGVQQ